MVVVLDTVLCVHCLAPLPSKGPLRTRDHAPPSLWYLPGSSGERPTAPSCPNCNAAQKEIETRVADLRLRFADDPRPAHAEIGAAALRALDPDAARGPKDRVHREAARRRIQKLAEESYSSRGGSPVLPGFEAGGPDSIGFPISRAALSRFTEKMVRVQTFWAFREYVVPPRKVIVFPPNAAALRTAKRSPGARVFQHAEGMTSVAVPRPLCGFRYWVFRIWDTLTLAAIEGVDDLLRRADYLIMDDEGTLWTNGPRK